jgi:DNA-binding SARP family transcriptional activator
MPPQTSPRIRLTALGGLALLTDAGPVSGAAGLGRNVALLALLDRAGEMGLHRDKLAAYLWPESSQSRARHSVDQAVYTLRQALGSDPFAVVGGGIALDRRVIDSDVSAFLRALEQGDAAAAVALYGGPFLDGFHLSGAAELERWVDDKRRALEGDFAGALEELARTAGEAGDRATAVEYWRRLAALSPLSSRVALALMHALVEAGDRAKALQAAAVHEALVREELGTRPDPSVLEYVAELKTAAASEPSAGPAASTAPPAASVPPLSLDAPAPESAPPDASMRSRGTGRRRLAAWVAAAAAIVAVLAAALSAGRRSAATPPEAPLVGIEWFENQTGKSELDVVGRLAADWVGEGLVRTGLVRVVAPGGDMRGTQSVIRGRMYREGGRLWLQASIRRPTTGVIVRALEPVSADTAAPTRALEPLRRQVMGAMGTLYDPRIDAFSESTLRPPSFEAYAAFAEGMDRYRARDVPGMAGSFRRAMELDPDYITARLWLAWTASMAGDWATADSLAHSLDGERQRMSPVERAWHDRQLALYRGDNQRTYEAALRMAELAPRSGWVIALADAAIAVNRPREAIAALEEAGLESLGPTRDHGAALLAAAYHMAGEYGKELEVTDETVREIGLDWDFVGPGVRALAALGRVEALEERLAEVQGMPTTIYGQPRAANALTAAVAELRAHGRPDAAAAVADRFLAPTGQPEHEAVAPAATLARARMLYELGRWGAAARLLKHAHAEPAPAERFGPADVRRRGLAALVAAQRGDPRAALALDVELAEADEPYLFGEPTAWRARIAAVLGEDERAIRLIRRAFAEGQDGRLRSALHTSRDFDQLREREAFRALY